jgi:hypothetical protein
MRQLVMDEHQQLLNQRAPLLPTGVPTKSECMRLAQ